MSYIITGKDRRLHVITKTKEITTSVLNTLMRLGCTEVAIRSAESVPEKQAEIIAVKDIVPISLATTSAEVLALN